MSEELVTVKPPRPLHGVAAKLLMKYYPDTDVAHHAFDGIGDDSAAAVAVRNTARAFLSAVETAKELEALMESRRAHVGVQHPNYYMALGEAFEQFVAQDMEAHKSALMLQYPTDGARLFRLPRGVRGENLLELFTLALKPVR